MLNPNNDRLDYGQVLAPPVNYKLDFAIGTTYSLDLDALVGACRLIKYPRSISSLFIHLIY